MQIRVFKCYSKNK